MNTAIGYKLFRIKKTCPGELFPLYVNADHSIPIGEWMIATCGQRTSNGKVKSKLGPLKFRPGFHINDAVPYVSHIGKKENGKICYMRDDTVWAEVEYIIDINYCLEAHKNGIQKNGKFNPVKADLDHIPVNGFYRYKTSPNMTGEWIIAGNMRVIRVLSDREVKRICIKAGSEYLPRQQRLNLKEFGFAAV